MPTSLLNQVAAPTSHFVNASIVSRTQSARLPEASPHFFDNLRLFYNQRERPASLALPGCSTYSTTNIRRKLYCNQRPSLTASLDERNDNHSRHGAAHTHRWAVRVLCLPDQRCGTRAPIIRGNLMNCPYCRSERTRRSKRRGFVERGPLTLISLKPFRCGDCGYRFYRWPIISSRLDTPTVKPLIAPHSPRPTELGTMGSDCGSS
jgi:hypothetical protein